MPENERRPLVLWAVIGVVVVALAVWLGIVVFGSDETPTPTTATVATPTTAEPPTTTTTPATTTSVPDTTSSSPTTSTPATTTPEATGPELLAVEVEEDLVRTFPVSAGWIVESDDASLTVGVSVGAQECYGLADAGIEETAAEVNVTMAAGFRSDPSGCSDVSPHWTYTFPLDSPLGDRVVVDTHTGAELGTEPPDPEEG